MNINRILGIFLIFALALMPVAMAATGEENVKVIHTNGTQDDSGIEDSDDDKQNTDELGDVWGIKQSDQDLSDLANIKTLGGVYLGITPLKNVSFIAIAISAGLAVVFTIVGIFLLVLVAGYGAAHPNTKKGWEYINSSRGKIIALGGIFFLALFMIVLMFFFLYVFSKLDLFGM